jgi:N-acetyl-gamma-glutamyl-phosphate reductase
MGCEQAGCPNHFHSFRESHVLFLNVLPQPFKAGKGCMPLIAMIKVGIIGATGYAGAELVRILSDHPRVELSTVTSRQYVGTPFKEIYPSLDGHIDLTCDAYDADDFCREVDIAFTALPHKLPMAIVPELLDRRIKVIDLSADYRFTDVETYETFYEPHSSPELCRQAVYGLSEVYKEQIRTAELVGNPGCYPTSALLPLLPLISENIIDRKSIIIDSKSGVSGAGRSPAVATLFCEVNEGFKAYKIGTHRHTPEIESILSRQAGEAVRITFVPHLVPLSRGMLTTIYANLATDISEKRIRGVLEDRYADEPFVRVHRDGSLPNVSYVRGTNYCNIGVKVDASSGRLVLVSVIDNLVKGAAGQAVQNMNLMMGFEETAGLKNAPYPV